MKPLAVKIIAINMIITSIIISVILIKRNIESRKESIATKDQIISELRYQLLNCKLTTMLELEGEKKNDKEGTD